MKFLLIGKTLYSLEQQKTDNLSNPYRRSLRCYELRKDIAGHWTWDTQDYLNCGDKERAIVLVQNLVASHPGWTDECPSAEYVAGLRPGATRSEAEPPIKKGDAPPVKSEEGRVEE